MKRVKRNMWRDERGLASFIVTFTLILIISLVVLGFAQIIRREQRQALDRNLSSRAFYAAESGINTAVSALNNGYSGAKPDCRPDGSGLLDSNAYTLDAASNTELNCLTIDDTPTSLEYPSVSKGQSLVVPIFAQSNMNRLEFSWQSTTASSATSYAACSASNGFLPQASWTCSAPVLRVDMIEVTSGISRSSSGNVYSVFMYPTVGGGGPTINYTAGSRSNMVNARCSAANTPNDCKVTLNMPGGVRNYYARIVAYYTDAKLTITPSNGTNPVELAGAQAIIDSTGKAQDITRRLQVRKSLSNIGAVPSFGIDAAAGLCKRYLVMKGNGTVGNSVLNVQSGGTLHDGSPCALD